MVRVQQDLVVLFGGSCSERRVSVASAQHLATLLPDAACWFWAPDGAIFMVTQETLIAHQRPFETDFVPGGKPRYASLAAALDDSTPAKTFFLALHGGAGEDGTVQALLEERRLYFTGSGAVASRRAFDKARAKKCVSDRGVRVAEAAVVAGKDAASAEKVVRELFAKHGRVVFKPVADGSSAGLLFINESADLKTAMARLAAEPAVPFLAEAFVAGTELTVGVIDTENGPRALPCSEVRKDEGRQFDFAGKYLGKGIREITPADVPPEVHAAAGKVAITAHTATGCRGYSRTDIIYTATGPVFLEINNLPGLTRASFIPQQLAAARITMPDFIDAQLDLARSRYLVPEGVAA